VGGELQISVENQQFATHRIDIEEHQEQKQRVENDGGEVVRDVSRDPRDFSSGGALADSFRRNSESDRSGQGRLVARGLKFLAAPVK